MMNHSLAVEAGLSVFVHAFEQNKADIFFLFHHFYQQLEREIFQFFVCMIFICCGIFIAILHSLLVFSKSIVCVQVRLCGCVQLASEFIYLILNQPSNSLIGQFQC